MKRRNLRMMSRLVLSFAQIVLLLGVGGVTLSLGSSEAVAQSRSFDEGPVIRRVALFRSDRFELSPALGTQVGSVYERGIAVGASADYHLTNVLSLGVSANVMPFALSTPLGSNFEDVNPERAARVNYARTFAQAELHVGLVPFSGKFNLIGDNILHYDVHVEAGFGAALRDSDSSDLSGMRPGPTMAVGARIFLRDNLALRLRLHNHLFNSADAQLVRRSGLEVPVDETLRQHYTFTVGLSFFFPDNVRISR